MLKKGFSLIELLIVLSIIGLLSAVLLPNFTSIQSKAKETSVKSVAHTIEMALETYYLTEGEYPEGTDLTLDSLATTLITNDSLSAVPDNPFTGTDYTSADTSGKITYTKDSDTEYSITAYGVNNASVILSLPNY